jgi:hypothetical protein
MNKNKKLQVRYTAGNELRDENKALTLTRDS